MIKSDGHWVLLDALQFVNNLSLSLRVDDPLNITLRRIFSEITGKMMRYSGCSHGLHLLSNAVLNEAGQVSVFEIHYLDIDESACGYLDSALEQRQIFMESGVEEDDLPKYTRFSKEGADGQGLQSILCDVLVSCIPCCPVIHEKSKWAGLLNDLNKKSSQPIVCGASRILVIPLSECSRKLPNGNLGTILLWHDGYGDDEGLWQALEERLLLAAKIFRAFVHKLLTTRYEVLEETYLPSFRIPGERPVAIMCANIRNFTPTTEVARNFGLLSELTGFMRSFHRTMCETIHNNLGRVHNLAGDRIMAIFGEHVTEEQAAKFAVKAAVEMCRKFSAVKDQFFAYERIQDFIKKEYEPMDFQLAIGVNVGQVIFDYFGAPGSRIYSPLGDHVSFAQLLESEAGQYDNHLGRVRAPILLSRPAWLKSGIVPGQKPLMLQLKGKSYEYPAYEYQPPVDTSSDTPL